jgi:hypothetical protein
MKGKLWEEREEVEEWVWWPFYEEGDYAQLSGYEENWQMNLFMGTWIVGKCFSNQDDKKRCRNIEWMSQKPQQPPLLGG